MSRRGHSRGRYPTTSRGRGISRSISGAPWRDAADPTALQNNSAFGQTLHFITRIKLQELEKQRVAFEAHAQILEEAKKTDDVTKRVEMLLEAVRGWSGSGSFKGQSSQIIGGKLNLEHLDIWLQQSKKDPCFSPAILENWAEILEAHILHNSTRFEYAKLFGNLLNEWIASGDSVTAASYGDDTASASAATTPPSAEKFVNMGRKEMFEQKERLQSIIFEPAEIDGEALKAYLEDLFSSDNAKEILNKVREQIQRNSHTFQHQPITANDMRWTIDSALSSDLMSEEKRATLKEMAANNIVLEELASVLNMRLANLESWSWPAEGVTVEMRRALNGKYRAFTDPDILDGLFLEYIGVSWQVYFRRAFEMILNSKAWKPSIPPLSRGALDRRRQFVPANREIPERSLEKYRVWNRNKFFFMSQLATSTNSRRKQYEGNDEDQDEDQAEDISPNATAVQIKQHLIHMMVTDCHLNTTIHKSHTVVRSDLEWFGPSLPHDSILILLEFFGLSKPWLTFFQSFLRTPTRFNEDPIGTVRTRQRGTPINYAISQLHGEVILFAMDFAVNQRADGLFLYRLHDDLWLWDAKPERVETAWAEMTKYASLVGLKFNEEKTGSARVGSEDLSSSGKLPVGDVRWGFLKFDPQKAVFVIDQAEVKPHITELQRQLGATKSTFGWVNAYNKYMAFFRRNFGGRPPACFGQAHIDDMIDTFATIQRELFPTHTGGAIEFLRSLISLRFGVDDIPEGYFYFPIAEGGLELRNPMIEVFALQRSDSSRWDWKPSDDNIEPRQAFVKEMEKDAENYRTLEDRWISSSADADKRNNDERYKLGQVIPEKFMSFDEYIQPRELLLSNWQVLYEKMLKVPPPRHIHPPPVLSVMETPNPDYYSDWVVALYGEGLVEKFGSLQLVDSSLIPVGMVDLFKTSRLKWDQ